MTDQEINIAIGDSLGRFEFKPEWSVVSKRLKGDTIHILMADHNGGVFPHEVAYVDYCHDLNAMNDAPHNLSLLQYAEYGDCLNRIVARDNSSNSTGYGVFDATAHQRAEAFLRVRGLWKDKTPGEKS